MSEIVVRHAEITDAQALQEIYAQPALYRDTLQIPHPSLTHFTERVTHLKPGSRNLVACIDGRVVGQLMLMVEQTPRRSHVATFGMGVDSHFQGKGVATALLSAMVDLCDNWLRIDRIELTVFVDNVPALAVYKKMGFDIEGTGKNYALRDGQFVDAYYMARFKPTVK